MYQYLEIKYI